MSLAPKVALITGASKGIAHRGSVRQNRHPHSLRWNASDEPPGGDKRRTLRQDLQAERQGPILPSPASTVMPPYLPYLATKGAIEQTVRVMSKDLGRKRYLRQRSLAWAHRHRAVLEESERANPEDASSLNPNGRIGRPGEIADTIAFLWPRQSLGHRAEFEGQRWDGVIV
ncbi:MAG: hypothetical protein Q9201_000554 [Fulgogasparrea decipioides]